LNRSCPRPSVNSCLLASWVCCWPGLLAAFNSTFAGTLNAAQAYIVNDIYLKYLRPEANSRQVSRTNYLTGDRGGGHLGDLWFLRPGCELGTSMDRIGPLGSLCGQQYPEMVLVALQRRGLFLGHAGGHRIGTDLQQDLRLPGPLLLPDHPGGSRPLQPLLGTYSKPPTDEETSSPFTRT
jgi:hypothetical protein